MQTITQALKNAAVNGTISLDKALKIASKFDQEREESAALHRAFERETGMTNGERINAHLAEMNGTYFSARDYHYERPVGEQ